MIPRSLSATSLQVAELCPARWNAEMNLRGARFASSAANVGIVDHNTFEEFVRSVFIKKDKPWDEDVFWEIFDRHAADVLGPSRTSDEYKDARDLANKWLHRPGNRENLESVKVLSVESKAAFELKTSAGIIPVNYIFDRQERIAPGEYRVVDYKSNRVALTPAQLRKKLQARLYALMTQIAYKDAEKIWVQFDFLRHEPVEILVKRDDNVVMFRELQRRAEDIIAWDEDKLEEKLNNECGWCVRKADCKTLQSNISVGGVMSKSIDDLARIHKKLTDQVKGQQNLLDEIEGLLLQHAIENEILEFETEDATVTVQAKKARSLNHGAVQAILGAAGLADEYQRFSVTDVDKILKQKLLPPIQAEMLKAAIKTEIREPKIKVEDSGY